MKTKVPGDTAEQLGFSGYRVADQRRVVIVWGPSSTPTRLMCFAGTERRMPLAFRSEEIIRF